ncbi:MAG: RNA polymerase sigma factor [Terriglobales bacterium]
MAPTSTFALDRKRFATLLAELYDRSGGSKWGVHKEDFGKHVAAAAAKCLPASATEKEVTSFLSGLRIEELVLARACSAGNEQAWEVFLTRFREPLYNAGRSIARDDATGRELADSLYADLYGMKSAERKRRSKLDYYMGRGSLEGWLRTVLAQEFVNRYRSHKRFVSLEEEEEAGKQFVAAASPTVASTGDAKLTGATDEALRALRSEEKFVLASYFLDDRTLAEIARMLNVHESTISRKLERAVKALRSEIFNALLQKGMSRRQAEEALEADVRDVAVDVRAALGRERNLQESGIKSFQAGKGQE